MISTHVAYKKLVSKGMSDELAETITEIMEERQDNLATKDDLKLLRGELNLLRSYVKRDISELRSELKQDISNLKSDFKQDMSDFKSDIFGWAIPTVIGVVSLNIAILGAIIALWFKV